MENEPICATGPGIGRPTHDHWTGTELDTQLLKCAGENVKG
jgi:hypothetical protein